MTDLRRSNVEFSKRVFLDRLTTDAQPLLQPANINQGPGDAYDYGGVGDAMNFGIGFDCSGLDGVVLAIAIFGPAYFTNGYTRLFSTETFPGPLPGFRQTTQADMLAGPYPLKVAIMHGGGGPDSHMACMIDGWHMESNGDHGVCTEPGDITPLDSTYWNDFWVWDAPIVEDTTWRQPMGYPQGIDYAGGRPSGAQIVAAGFVFVCRYLNDGGTSLPEKQLIQPEVADLEANNVGIVSNFESSGTDAQQGSPAGVADAQAGNTTHLSLGGPADRPIYFSLDWDEAPAQDAAVDDYFRGVASVIGLERAGAYGPYWILSRLLDAGLIRWAWQTEAWSGGNVDARINIMQRNGLGFATVGGVQCDIDEAHTDDYGQWNAAQPAPQPTPGGTITLADVSQDEWNALVADVKEIRAQLGGDSGWPQAGADPAAIKALEARVATGGPLSVVDVVSWLKHHVSAHKTPTP